MFQSKEEAMTTFPMPREVQVNGDGTNDYDSLWSVAAQHQPQNIVELGTRTGMSTRVLRSACPNARITTVDPVDCSQSVRDIPNCTFYLGTGEDAFHVLTDPVDLLFIDTDPHSYEQTKMWLETWVSNRLSDKGIVCLHDTIASAVLSAIQEWLKPPWRFIDLGWGNGMGVLWRENADIL